MLDLRKCPHYLEPDQIEHLVLNTEKLMAMFTNRLENNPVIARVKVRYKNGPGSHSLIGQLETGQTELDEDEIDEQREEVIDSLKKLVVWHLESKDILQGRYTFQVFSPGQVDQAQTTLDALLDPNVAAFERELDVPQRLHERETIVANHDYRELCTVQREEIDSLRVHNRELEKRLLAQLDQPTQMLRIQMDREAMLSRQLTGAYGQLTDLYAQQFNVELAAEQHRVEQGYADERHKRHMAWLEKISPYVVTAAGPRLRGLAQRVPLLRRFVGGESVEADEDRGNEEARPSAGPRAPTLSAIAITAINQLMRAEDAVRDVLSGDQFEALHAFARVARKNNGINTANAFNKLHEQISQEQLMQLGSIVPDIVRPVMVLNQYAAKVAAGDASAIAEIRAADKQQ